jgi:hypothetical protein
MGIFAAKNLGEGQLTVTGEETLYTVPAGRTTIIRSIHLTNTDTVRRTLNVYYKKSGSASRRIAPKNMSLSPGFTLILENTITMTVGDKICGDAEVNSKVDYVISGVEES